MRGGFNEAGAGCPGIRGMVKPVTPAHFIGFNEAGAGCPGIPGWTEMAWGYPVMLQ